jgi:hypothetical protein
MSQNEINQNSTTAITPVAVSAGNKAPQNVVALTQLGMNINMQSMVDVVRVKLRGEIDSQLSKLVRLVGKKTDEINATKTAIAKVGVPVPEEFRKKVRAVSTALKYFYPDVCMRESVQTLYPGADVVKATIVITDTSGERSFATLLTFNESSELPEAVKPLMADHARLEQEKSSLEAEILSLRAHRGRLSEMAEEAAAAMTLAQLTNVEGGDALVGALNEVTDRLRNRVGLTGPAEDAAAE